MVKKYQRGRLVVPHRKLIQHIQKLRVNTVDIVVLSLPETINLQQHKYIAEMFKVLLPENRLLILDGGKQIRVLSVESIVSLGAAHGAH